MILKPFQCPLQNYVGRVTSQPFLDYFGQRCKKKQSNQKKQDNSIAHLTKPSNFSNPPFYIDLAQDSMALPALPRGRVTAPDNHPTPNFTKSRRRYINLIHPLHSCHFAIAIPKITTVFRNSVITN